jgi:hypothetical protein
VFALNGFEQRLEVSLAKAAAALALDDFEEQRRPVFNGAREYLEHVPFIVAVH